MRLSGNMGPDAVAPGRIEEVDMSKTVWLLMVAFAAFVLRAPVLMAAESRVERVSFKAGAASATLKGAIKGDQTVDYVLAARAGQMMSVTLDTSNGANFFNVLPPGSDAAIANGSTLGNAWAGTLPVDGDYRVRVYLMRSAARRNEQARYTLTLEIAGSKAAAAAPTGDAKVAGTPYHATGKVPCSVGPDPKGSAQCSFGVIRGAPGTAEVHLADPGFDVSLHKDQLRVLRFAGARVTSPDPKVRVTAEKKGDEWSIAIDGFQFFTIPEAVIVGG
ncbi:hypothetical protein [Methylotetracoccus oryzae]|uniref:hypothetical protein n=1 Tax=Methylotetracoccus oryzae TaxID=1919059 RepID=UPI00111B5E13|nr:hypothetical protein [Methylotetracoccus oryzae]